MTPGVVELTRTLIQLDTSGIGEDHALAVIAPVLEAAGFALTVVPWLPGRSNLVAKWNGGGPLTLSGHVDTVPHGFTPWLHGALSAEMDGDRLYGRGSSDMKGGVAAMVLAAINAARPGSSGFTVAITSGEETGCEGGFVLRDADLLHPEAIFIIGESTANAVRLGHKGATWLSARAAGKAAHGSRPELGTNAIELLAGAIAALHDLEPGTAHPHLGTRTTNVGTISGGSQTNLVPDSAHMTVDVRPVPGADAAAVRELLAQSATLTTDLDLPAIWSDPDSLITTAILDAVESVTKRRSNPAGVSYFTDAAALDLTQSRSYIVGPGDVNQPHTTDEWVSVALLEESVSIYEAILTARQTVPAMRCRAR